MNVLIVNFYYAPTIDAHAYRWTQIAEYWAKCGFTVEVITGKVEGSPSTATESGVKVRRVGLTSRYSSTGVDQNLTLSQNILKNRILSILRAAYRKIYWPDALWHWLPYALVEIFRRRRIRYDLVVSYYPCFSAHLAVRILKLVSHNPRFKWILDYGDPFCASETWQPNNYMIYDILNKLVEKNCSRYGTLVFTNSETTSVYSAKLNTSNGFITIPHLVDVSKFYSGSNHKTNFNTATVSMCYIGAFHANIREPYRLFKLIKKLISLHGLNVKLDIYGPPSKFDLSPSDCSQIRYYGYIQREKATEVMKNSDFIITVDNENCIMTPSKIVECIATGKPIINIANPQVSYSPMNMYTEMGYAISVYDKIMRDSSVTQVYEFIQKHHGLANVSSEVITNVLRDHLIEVIADAYIH